MHSSNIRNAALKNWEKAGTTAASQTTGTSWSQTAARTPVRAGSSATLQDENNNCGACNSREATPATVSATAAVPLEKLGFQKKRKGASNSLWQKVM
jgi:hypothetical protein